ncbi:MAG: diacylglycerol/lipid kinase family protein [Anaeromyxobacteraceae bacterium]
MPAGRPSVKPHLIVNPASANGRTGRHFDAVARAVRGAVGDFELSFTQRRGDGALLAREAARAGGDLVVAVGGDGTASEVADGLATAERRDVVFGFIPRGTGGDLRRTLGLPEDPAEAARLLRAGAERRLDLGRIELTGHDGSRQVRHFTNVAGFGIAGRVVQHVERTGKALGGKAAFMIASARALAGWSDQRVRWRVDGGPWREDVVTAVSVCNGRYFGGGMMVAPDARPDDGVFDVTVWKGLGLRDFVLRKGMLYDGTHVRLPNTERLRATVVEAEPLDGRPVLLDVDGEQPGMLPARITVLPGALCARVGSISGDDA